VQLAIPELVLCLLWDRLKYSIEEFVHLHLPGVITINEVNEHSQLVKWNFNMDALEGLNELFTRKQTIAVTVEECSHLTTRVALPLHEIVNFLHDRLHLLPVR